jgi:osmoprotectant transport system permease protein
VNAILGALTWFADPSRWSGPSGIPTRIVEHLYYSGMALGITVLIAVPAGLLLGHLRRGRLPALLSLLVIGTSNAARALPTLGLLTLAVMVTASGVLPALVPLVILAIPPVLVNTYTGVQQVDRELPDAAAAMGMTGGQVLWQVELPSALPLIILGVRTAAIQILSTATIAAFIGLGGLGRYIIDGLALQDYSSTAGGAILVIALAFATQGAFAALHRLVVSPGVRRRVEH